MNNEGSLFGYSLKYYQQSTKHPNLYHNNKITSSQKLALFQLYKSHGSHIFKNFITKIFLSR